MYARRVFGLTEAEASRGAGDAGRLSSADVAGLVRAGESVTVSFDPQIPVLAEDVDLEAVELGPQLTFPASSM